MRLERASFGRLEDAWRDERGQDLVEYAMLMAFIGLVCIVALQNLGTAVNKTYQSVSTSLVGAVS